MKEIIDEITRLQVEINNLRDFIESNYGMLSDITGSKNDSTSRSSSRKYRASIEYKFGTSMTRYMKSGWRSAVRPWVDSPRIRSQVLKSLGLSSLGFFGGFVSGLYGLAINTLLDGIAKIFRKKHSPLMPAIEPEQAYGVFFDDLTPMFNRALESELIRGGGMRLMSREDYRRNGPLARQLQRGVVGL